MINLKINKNGELEELLLYSGEFTSLIIEPEDEIEILSIECGFAEDEMLVAQAAAEDFADDPRLFLSELIERLNQQYYLTRWEEDDEGESLDAGLIISEELEEAEESEWQEDLDYFSHDLEELDERVHAQWEEDARQEAEERARLEAIEREEEEDEEGFFAWHFGNEYLNK